jgi:hypothetical protein
MDFKEHGGAERETTNDEIQVGIYTRLYQPHKYMPQYLIRYTSNLQVCWGSCGMLFSKYMYLLEYHT